MQTLPFSFQQKCVAIILVGVGAYCSTVCRAEFMIAPPAGQSFIECEGVYSGHLQGIATDGIGSIFWSYTARLVRTDCSGKLIKAIDVPSHHGDLCYFNGKIYVAVNLGPFSKLQGADSWVYSYDAKTLGKMAEFPVSRIKYGAGGIENREGRFYIVGGLHKSESQNYLYEYDNNFVYRQTHELATGYTTRGIQTVAFAAGHWWFGTYHTLDKDSHVPQLFKCDARLENLRQYSVDASWGIAALNDKYLLVASNRRVPGLGHVGRIEVAALNSSGGLDIVHRAEPEPLASPLKSDADLPLKESNVPPPKQLGCDL